MVHGVVVGDASCKVTKHKEILGVNDAKKQGKGVKVFIVDGTFDPYSDKKNLSNSFMATAPAEGSPEALRRRLNALKQHSHANHIASTIGGEDGIAPKVELHVIDVENDPALTHLLTFEDRIAAAINKAIESAKREQELFLQAPNGEIVGKSHFFMNLSGRLSVGDEPIPEKIWQALLSARDVGIGIVKSAGNDGEAIDKTPYTQSLARLLEKMGGFMRIAANSKYDENNNEILSVYSNSADIAKRYTLTAPGSDILAYGADNKLVVLSGTSMAAPSATGVACLVASENPHLNAAEVFNLMDRMARTKS